MTMKNPLDGEREIAQTKFDSDRRYRWTWPGQRERITSGKELNEILGGADPAMLNIHEVREETRTVNVEPEPFSRLDETGEGEVVDDEDEET